MNVGDVLEARVRQHVTTLVPPELVDTVTHAVGATLAVLMNDATFTTELRVVRALQEENLLLRQADVMLRQNILQLQRALALKAPVRPKPRKRAAKQVPMALNKQFTKEADRYRR